ncbi:hypothetical protein NLG97_g3878 [Lecanicillium saksenae]|uniref:Uncharacterized protein n=1 Tax=Lecanicillium saksenae TaxID=468837 RepID=A0ACC1R024_9HYPO|nr:hypothetical protein NLG97_g3878 [Lecanicillium saksenae]
MPGTDGEVPMESFWPWMQEYLLQFAIAILKTGKIPQHVAFEMDGNRRYARQHHLAVREGHSQGCHSLYRLLDSTYKCGVKVVTIYLFSTENFNRTDAEVQDLMELFIYMMDKFSAPGEVLDRNGVCLRILGQRELIRADVLAAADRGIERTRHNSKLRSNLFMTAAVVSAVQGHLNPPLEATKDGVAPDGGGSIQMASLENHIFTADNPPMDLLIRTSGVERLSDFLLWQVHQDTELFFVKTLWPAFSFFHFAAILFEWQWRRSR